MKFSESLLEGRLIRRYKRFMADVTLVHNGDAVTAHCANSGSMLGVKEPGLRVWLSPADNPARKLKYTWELVEVDDTLVGVNTSHPNRLVADAVADGVIEPLAGYDTIRKEVRYGKNSRIDLLLQSDGKPDCYVEVKNVHMCRETGLAEFPDAATARGAKHLHELGHMVAGGARAVNLYLIQRGDCDRFTIASDIDPAYADAFRQARAQGVEALAYRCEMRLDGIGVAERVAIDME